MGKAKGTATPPETPHKIYFEDGNLVVFFQRKHKAGALYLGYHKAADLWYPRVSALESINRWYESMEASRRKAAAGITDRPRDPNHRSDSEIHESAILALTWLTDAWGRAA